ncbi:PLD nuclease N-terminal domain-containing protein [Salinibacterium sp. G-O1]|uniref:PLD nuclease N-terminal domain-containing protein n=1 Tax=Salinibacterium sp. G-O1 TaxID=3046208 RepID=UPI0024BA5696|nr:PLD nuclease N-terminal domain-containing protein [Salinibacterium sp. G-O1]MDJ0335742.1 PLD nuclease N-terminal domain-containing protein [Salinibacterium sp. G-O1]
MFQLVLTVGSLALMIFALVDVITADSWKFRYLDKVSWAFIVILLPLIGSILWFALGKQRSESTGRGTFGDPRRHQTVIIPPTPVDDEAAVEREIEFHEREARIRRLEAELRAKRSEE